MDKYLAFVDYAGKSIEGEYIYRFDFTDDTDSVWGDYFNVTPTVIIPDLQPEENTISKSARVKFDKELNLAKKSGCFSMQDCFDKIISLAFTELTEEETIYYEDEPLRFDFGETFQEVENKLKACGYEFFDIVEKEIGDETIIDELIESIEEENEIAETNYVEFLTLKIGDTINREDLKQLFYNSGYEKTDYVHKSGQYTFRGHIIDIFSFKEKHPFRVSCFGNTVEKIIQFDEMTQDELEKLKEIILYRNENF